MRLVATGAVLVLGTILAGCTSSGFRELPVTALDTDPAVGQAPIVGVELVDALQLEPARPDVAANWRRRLPPAFADDAIYVLDVEDVDGPPIACELRPVYTGGGSIMVPMPGGGMTSVALPGGFQTQHQERSLLLCDHILPREDELLCRVANTRVGPHYFARAEGIESLLTRIDYAMHPGYAPIAGDFWVVVPRRHARAIQLPTESEEFEQYVDPRLRRLGPPWVFPVSDSEYPLLRDSLLHRADRPLTAEEPEPAVLTEVAMAQVELVPLCAHLVERGHGDEAIGALDRVIDRSAAELWWGNGALYPLHLMLLMLHVARGEYDAAVAEAGAVLHDRDPGWFFPPEPHLNVSPASGFEPLARAIGPQLVANWPMFLARLESAAPDLVASRRGSAVTSAGIAPPEDPASDLGELLARLLLGGPLVEPALETAIERAYEQAVEAAPDAVETRWQYVNYCRWDWRMPRGAAQAGLAVADELQSLDPLQGHLARSELLATDGDLAGAEQELRSCMTLEPAKVEWQRRIGDMYRVAGRYAQACRLFSAIADTVEGGYAADYDFAATASLGRLELEEGIRRAERYLGRDLGPGDPSRADAEYCLATLWEIRGDFQRAQAAYERVLKADPEHQLSEQALEGLGGYRMGRTPY